MFMLTAIECFILIIVVFAFLYWITPQKLNWIPMLVTVILLSVLAFNIVPNENDDLTRYFMQLDYFRIYGYDLLERYIEEGFMEWDTYRVCAYYFYFMSKFPSNSYFPAVTMFIVYGLMFLVIYKAAKRFNVNKLNCFLGILFFLSTYWYYDTYSGIRNGLTFAVIFACAYYHLVERKNILLCYFGYILACLTHSAGIILVALVILTEITPNNSGKFMNFLLVFGLAAGGALIDYLSEVTDNSFIASIAGRAEAHEATGGLYTATNYLVNIVVFAVVAFILLYVSVYIIKGKYASELKRLYKFSSIVSYFLVGCLLSELIFLRIVRWILPILGALIFMIGMQIQKDQIEEKGRRELLYFSPFSVSIRIKTRSFVYIAFFAFSMVHLWYLINGSSLLWMSF